MDHQRVAELLRADMGASEIARVVGCSRMQVYRIMQNYT
nr:helix-turn-helix domain-containing protein [Mesorhizobium sp.]